MSPDKATRYAQLARELEALLAGERDAIANLANTAALLHTELPDLNWTGFYILRGDELVLGPFQGRPACVRIPIGRGVCGAAAQRRESIVVADVHAFADHIVCDAASNAELVVPLIANDGRLLGVMDLDSPKLARFDEQDRLGLERCARCLVAAIEGATL